MLKDILLAAVALVIVWVLVYATMLVIPACGSYQTDICN